MIKQIKYLKDFSFTFIELPKFNKTKIEELVSYEDKWCYFFKHADWPDDMRKFLASFPDIEVIEKAYNTLEAHNWTSAELQSYERSEKAYYDALAREQYIKEEAEAKGLAEGLEKGLAEGGKVGERNAQQNFAIEMLIDGDSLEKIAKYTHLSIKEIEALQKNISHQVR